jgi:hypothetical protein
MLAKKKRKKMMKKKSVEKHLTIQAFFVKLKESNLKEKHLILFNLCLFHLFSKNKNASSFSQTPMLENSNTKSPEMLHYLLMFTKYLKLLFNPLSILMNKDLGSFIFHLKMKMLSKH